MATDAQTLLAQANCYSCFSSNPYMLQMVQVAMLRQILLTLNPMATTDAQTLLNQASCYQCYSSSPYMLQMIELALLQAIINQGLGGGSSQIVAYTGATPNADGVTPPNKIAPAIAVKPNSTAYTWSIANQDWE